MPTYVYETIPSKTGAKAKRFEIQQSMKDAALTKHPETGEPVRRLILGGYGLIGANTGRTGEGAAAPSSASKPASGGHSCGTGCGCAN